MKEGSSLNWEEKNTVQSDVNFGGLDRTTKEEDQLVSDGEKYFIWSHDRGFSRGSRRQEANTWDHEKTESSDNKREVTMLIYKDLWLVRHKDAPDVPFEVWDKETLKKKEGDDVPQFIGANDEEKSYLKWTPLDKEYEENKSEGNRWMRASPMFYDTEFIYMMV